MSRRGGGRQREGPDDGWQRLRNEAVTLSMPSAQLSVSSERLSFTTRESTTDCEGSWMIACDHLLVVYGWHMGTSRLSRPWKGTFRVSNSKERDVTIDGVGQCKALVLNGSITGQSAPKLSVEMTIAMSEGSKAVMWRADVGGANESTQLETITLLAGQATVQGTVREVPQWKRRQEEACWFLGACFCCCSGWMFYAMSLMSVLGSTIVGIVSLNRIFELGRAWRKTWVWWSVLINGWQSFSYAGFISLEWCYGLTSWLRMLLAYTGLWRLQPMPQVGWAFSGAFHDGGRMPPRRFLEASGEGGLFGHLLPHIHRQAAALSSDMYAVITAMHPRGSPRRSALLAGFLSQREQFGLVALDPWRRRVELHASCDGARLDPGGVMRTDWAVLKWAVSEEEEPALGAMEWFTEAVGGHCRARVPEAVGGGARADGEGVAPTGWCSWYEHMEKVSGQIVADNARVMEEMKEEGPKLEVLQLDDGYAPCWGDWELPKPTFPHGLKGAANTAEEHGLQAGLWIAAWTADKQSQVVAQHPEWVVRRRGSGLPLAYGGAANSGFTHPGKWFYGLDATHPECREHVTALIRRLVREYGFSFLKVDFLHAAALPGQRFDAGKTRAQALQMALEAVREGAGSAFVMGCSCPLGAAVGLVDGMRVSADTAAHWKAFPVWWDKTNLPSGRNMVRNTMVRQFMHRRWWINNPDCVVLRHFGGGAEAEAEAQGRVSVAALTGGLFFLSDDLVTLRHNRRMLSLARTLTPPLLMGGRAAGLVEGEAPEVLVERLEGAEGGWALVGLFNWSGSEDGRAVTLEAIGASPGPGEHVVCLEFWGQVVSMGWAGTLQAGSVPPRSVKVMAVRRRALGQAAYLGSSLHISCGRELTRWAETEGGVEMDLCLGARGEGHVCLYLPQGGASPPHAYGPAYSGGEVLPLCKQGGQPMAGAWKVPVVVDASRQTLCVEY